MTKFILKLRPVIDIALAPLAFIGAIANVAVSRWTWRLPVCSWLFDQFGIQPIRHHYYSPLVRRRDIHKPLSEDRTINGLDLNEGGQLELLDELNYREELELLSIPDSNTFGGGDAEYLYSIIRRFKPRTILEIGCGQSTRIAQSAIAANRQIEPTFECNHICVEPFEQPWLEELGVTVHRKRIEELDPAIVENLSAGDILFIDSSHVIRPQGDVIHEYLDLGSVPE